MFNNLIQQVKFYKKILPERNDMDTTRYKSVTIGIETWKKLNLLADKNMRSIGRTIEYHVSYNDFVTRKYENGESDLTPEKYFGLKGKSHE